MGGANALSNALSQGLGYFQNQRQNQMDQQYIDLLRSGQNTYFNPTRV
jgi:hypothetical protein